MLWLFKGTGSGNVNANEEMFSYISTNESIGVMNCHIFTVAPDLGQLICTAVKNGVIASNQNQKKRGSNPFQAAPGTVKAL